MFIHRDSRLYAEIVKSGEKSLEVDCENLFYVYTKDDVAIFTDFSMAIDFYREV